jgi:hypothetical protein
MGSTGATGPTGPAGSISVSDVQGNTKTYAADTGTANTYAVALSPALGAYAAGVGVEFRVTNANTGASTLNVNGLGAKALTKSGTTALASGDLKAGQIVTAIYDGTQFQLQGVGGAGLPWPDLAFAADIPAASPNAMDDEFAGSSLNGSLWTTLNLLSGQSITVANGLVTFTTSSAIQSRLLAIVQPTPAGTWRVRTKIYQDCATSDFIGMGLCMRRTSGSLQCLGVVPMIHVSFNHQNTILALKINNVTYSSELDCYYYPGTTWYMDAEYDGTNVNFYISASGRSFSKCFSESAATFLGGAPDQVGLYMHPWCNTSNGNWAGQFSADFFRRIA